ncbi:uncharacterized protein Eint_030750 [Encephalitozoon intestinalis ATCC 50506]|uniref:Uncharacterized protein n=1 Tax=Encephalitozoon intestinalis (strain ATCC 50506) TaxID=876142 RepID=E0S684_ENCIT|nr:uncharacterized protein Eint_030750 [Encephalitozoon intestinalis ATCC 50506]ADM11219.1 hypothetical protein Eint_030750 [Encephalitozoon intestinalis ATCC 50506]UTX44887.1 hypothetical protein GPK93_03g04140 [Encephalitozoon intestinalis]
MSIGDYALVIFETTGNSFAIGCSMAFASSMFKQREEQPHSRLSLRRGGELAKHAMIYSSLYYGLRAIRATGWIRHLAPPFIASFTCGIRNGRGFGVRSGLNGVASSLMQEVVNKMKWS